jgi:hypothetical protein
VAPGAYGDQTISSSPRGGVRRVVLRPARRPGRVTVGNLVVLGRHVEVRDMRVGSAKAGLGADDVTFRGLRMRGLFIDSASRVRVIGGDIGPGVNYNPEIRRRPGRASRRAASSSTACASTTGRARTRRRTSSAFTS